MTLTGFWVLHLPAYCPALFKHCISKHILRAQTGQQVSRARCLAKESMRRAMHKQLSVIWYRHWAVQRVGTDDLWHYLLEVGVVGNTQSVDDTWA